MFILGHMCLSSHIYLLSQNTYFYIGEWGRVLAYNVFAVNVGNPFCVVLGRSAEWNPQKPPILKRFSRGKAMWSMRSLSECFSLGSLTKRSHNWQPVLSSAALSHLLLCMAIVRKRCRHVPRPNCTFAQVRSELSKNTMIFSRILNGSVKSFVWN